MTKRSHPFFPCASFFEKGQILTGLAVLLMQLTLVLWPAAARMARVNEEQTGLQQMLAELSEKHSLPVDPYPPPRKKFRQLA